MKTSNRFIRTLAFALVIAVGLVTSAFAGHVLPPDPVDPPGGPPPNLKALVGQALFFDTSLSSPQGQSCASCHDPGNGWADARSRFDPLSTPTSEGVVAGRFGPRNSLPMAYANLAPSLFYDAASGGYIGGRYWDGRSANSRAAAKVPFMSPLEMSNPTMHQVVLSVRKSASAGPLEQIYGSGIWTDEGRAFDAIAECLSEFQTLGVLNGFTSRFDRFLKGDSTILTPYEQAGRALFEGKGTCTACHPSAVHPDGTPPRFTTYRYYNLGVPKNPRNPFYGMPASVNPEGAHYVDKGLGGALALESQVGKFKVPTLRNVALTAPYMHNGVFTTLYDAVQFHNTRDIDARWGAPEVPFDIIKGPMTRTALWSIEGSRIAPPGDGGPDDQTAGIGNLALSAVEVDQIVAFLKTLND